MNEALHMTDEEHDIFVSLMQQIRNELQNKHDEFQNAIIVGYIELVLNFCQRFYNRQFATRTLENSDILMKFDNLLSDYYERKNTAETWFAYGPILCRQALYVGQLLRRFNKKGNWRYSKQLHSSVHHPAS